MHLTHTNKDGETQYLSALSDEHLTNLINYQLRKLEEAQKILERLLSPRQLNLFSGPSTSPASTGEFDRQQYRVNVLYDTLCITLSEALIRRDSFEPITIAQWRAKLQTVANHTTGDFTAPSPDKRRDVSIEDVDERLDDIHPPF